MKKSLRLLLLLLVSSAAIGQTPARVKISADPGGPFLNPDSFGEKAAQTLFRDEQLRIRPANIVPVKAEWSADARSRFHILRSISSDDFSDLQFLKPLLAGKRVVQLGESGHGVSQFSTAKVRLIKFLHQQMGYDVIAFESSLPQCYLADQAVGSAPPIDVMRQCIFPVWHSTEALALFDYLDATRKAGKRLTLTGFDTQNSASMSGPMSPLAKMLELDGWPRAPEMGEIDGILFKRSLKNPLTADAANRVRAFYREAADELEKNQARLLQDGADRASLGVAIQSAKSRIRLADQFESGSIRTGTEARDLGMADNLDFVLDTLYPGRKVIVWAHNGHIAYEHPQGGPKMMGEYIAQRRKNEVYTIGLYMGRGAEAMNDRKTFDIPAPDAGSFDAVMTNTSRFAFVDFSAAKPGPGTEWIFTPVAMREWGGKSGSYTFTPARAYDGVLYIDSVRPPEYR